MTNPGIWQSETHATKCELAAEVLRCSGKLRLQVEGWSMLPCVFPGDTLVVERADCADIGEGDIVLFRRDRRLFAHRVIARSGAAILTRGDAMAKPDPMVRGQELLGRVTRIVRNGKSREPRKTLRAPERAIAAMIQRSGTAGRIVVGIHGLRRTSAT